MEQTEEKKWARTLSDPAGECGITIYQVGEEYCDPRHGYGPAVRDHYLIHCVLEGGGRLVNGTREWRIRSGQGFLIIPEEINYYEADEAEPWHYCWVGFHGRDVPGILKRCGISEASPVFHFHDAAKMEKCVRRMGMHYKNREEGFLALSKLYEFFAMLQGEEEEAGASERLAPRVKAFLEKNYSYGITVGEAAKALSVDRSHMFRSFKEEYGVSVQRYLLDYRLERAGQLLKRSDMNVTEIMYSCGFSDLPNFSRQFKKKYGMAPAQCRKISC